jgi:dolichyl-diphosphooligosaccharide--protein glycosyltransferase
MATLDDRLDLGWVKAFFAYYGARLGLVLAMVFTFATRIRGFEKFIGESGTIYFGGNDAWYHYRQVKYTVEHWPSTMPFDPWTGFPVGSDVGQFGTLFDQLLATTALLIGLGNPSDHTIRLVMLFAPPVFAALTLLPTYALAKRLADGDEWAGLLAAGILATLPGSFFFRGLVGAADHNIAEPLFMLLAVVALVSALRRAQRDSPVVEVLQTREYSVFRPTLVRAALAGVALALYLAVWPPGVIMFGVLGIFVTVDAVRSHLSHRSPEPMGIAVGSAMLVSAVLTLPLLTRYSLSVTHLSLLQVALPVAIAGWVCVLSALARVQRTPWSYVGTVAGVVAGGAITLNLAAPSAFALLQRNTLRVVGLGAMQGSSRTIQEAQTLASRGPIQEVLVNSYGMMFFVAAGAVLYLLYRAVVYDRSSDLLVVVWAVIIALAAFTQVRFGYYLAPTVAVLAGTALVTALRKLDVSLLTPRSLSGAQVIAILLVGVLLTPTLAVPVNGGITVMDGERVTDGGQNYRVWEESLSFLNGYTPEEGQLGEADNPLDYYGTFERTDDFEYPDGSYGVMAWWDYGHLITVGGERVPVANPFQQHATPAAKYLLAQSEEEAEQVVTDDLGAEQPVKYVMVDWQVVNPLAKFTALASFHPTTSMGDYLTPFGVETSQGTQVGSYLRTDQYYQSLMVRLYHYHGSAVSASSGVLQYDIGQNGLLVRPSDTSPTRFFNSSADASEFVANTTNTQQGGFGVASTTDVDALEHYRLVHTSQTDARQSSAYARSVRSDQFMYNQSARRLTSGDSGWVKTFERVDGATIEGTGPANTTVRAAVPVQSITKRTGFYYVQYAETDANGSFTMTVPYSTTGYDAVQTTADATVPLVRGAGAYQFSAVTETGGNMTVVPETLDWTASANVSELQVIGENATAVHVELQPEVGEDESEEETGGGTTNTTAAPRPTVVTVST